MAVPGGGKVKVILSFRASDFFVGALANTVQRSLDPLLMPDAADSAGMCRHL
jgi:hypothetical protein